MKVYVNGEFYKEMSIRESCLFQYNMYSSGTSICKCEDDKLVCKTGLKWYKSDMGRASLVGLVLGILTMFVMPCLVILFMRK